MVSVNTALALAANGSRVVLLDCDLRRPTVRLQFGIQKEGPGVSEVLKGECSLNEALCEVDGTSLLILAGSSPAEDAAELIGSSQMEQLLQVLREGVDYIILDSPPAGLIADAASVSEYADLVLYVVRQNYCAARTVLQSIRHLSQSGGVFAGYVLNDVQSGITEAVSRYGYNGYNGHYYGKYGAYYGYGESREKERSEEPRTTYYTEDDA